MWPVLTSLRSILTYLLTYLHAFVTDVNLPLQHMTDLQPASQTTAELPYWTHSYWCCCSHNTTNNRDNIEYKITITKAQFTLPDMIRPRIDQPLPDRNFAAAVLFRLKFDNDTHYKFKSSQVSKARLQSSKNTGTKQNLMHNGHSRLFEVTCFVVSGKAIRD